MSTYRRRLFAGITAVAAAIACAPSGAALAQQPAAQSGAATAQPRPPSVTAAKVERQEVRATILVSGNLAAREEVLVQPEVDGLSIIEVLAEEGQTVRAGQILVRLNRAALDVSLAQNGAQISRGEAAIAQARAQIVEAEANRVQSANALGRAQTLRTEGITSADIFDQRVAAARGAEARLSVARQALASAEADLAATRAARQEIELRILRSEIKAPRGGVISRRNARLGAVASMAAQDPLFRIIADSAVELEAEVPEADLPRLAVGKPAMVTPAGASAAIEGRIRLISPEVDRQTRLGRARIELPGAAVRSVGAFAKGVIEVDRRTGLTVPLSAVTWRRDEATVQVIDAGVARIRPVKLGLSGAGRVEVTEGLREGDLVVARAGTFIRDGDAVSPVPVN
jgi:HlyD family secretion protein